jgi:hypothetical protein
VPELNTPYGRLCRTAAQLGVLVLDAVDDQGPWLSDDAAALVACGECIAINPDLEDEAVRADVVAMALALTYVMGDDKSPATNGHGRGITAEGSFVLISRTRVAKPSAGPGELATMIAREHGRDTPSAAFEYSVPVFS